VRGFVGADQLRGAVGVFRRNSQMARNARLGGISRNGFGGRHGHHRCCLGRRHCDLVEAGRRLWCRLENRVVVVGPAG
jgi:hypothetical protein